MADDSQVHSIIFKDDSVEITWLEPENVGQFGMKLETWVGPIGPVRAEYDDLVAAGQAFIDAALIRMRNPPDRIAPRSNDG